MKLKKDYIQEQHNGSFTTYPKDNFFISPRITVDEGVSIQIQLLLKDKNGNQTTSLGYANFKNESYDKLIKHVDGYKLKDSAYKLIAEQITELKTLI